MKSQHDVVKKCMKKIDESVSLFFIRSRKHLDDLLKAGCNRSHMVFKSLAAAFLIFITFGSSPLWAQGVDVVEPGETFFFDGGTQCFTRKNVVDNALQAAAAFCRLDDFDGRAEAAAHQSLTAAGETIFASATVVTDFFISGQPSKGILLDATVSADVSWFGYLYSAIELAGGGPNVLIEMYLVDENTGATMAYTKVLEADGKTVGFKGIELGAQSVSGDAPVSLRASVVRGHFYSIRLRLTCTSSGPLAGFQIGCYFFEDNIFGLDLTDGFARMSDLTITVAQDVFVRFDQIDQTLEELKAGQSEIMRLLLTPQGRRETEFLTCEDGPCDFPATTN